jgi:hypothetical protein
MGGKIGCQRRYSGRLAVDPGHPFRAGLRSRHGQRAGRRVDARHCQAAVGKLKRERAGPAAQIQNVARTQLAGDRGVHVEITAVGIERVIDRHQPRVLEDRIRHQASR